MEEADRNPSPPPELLNNEDLLPDRIGDSVFSKQWLFKILMKILEWNEAVSLPKDVECTIADIHMEGDDITSNEEEGSKVEKNETSEVASTDVEASSSNVVDKDDVKVDMIELDSKIEADACTLWDMTANEKVAEFLHEIGAVNIFLDIIDKTKSPRLCEITVGILGNMLSFDSVCQEISKNKKLLSSVLSLTGTSDVPTLLQTFRAARCGLLNDNCKDLWFTAIEENMFVMENIKFIFENSLNHNLIKEAFNLLHSILYYHNNCDHCLHWGQESYAAALIQGATSLVQGVKQLDIDCSLDTFFFVLAVILQHDQNKKTFACKWSDLSPVYVRYILSIDEEETLPDSDSIPSLQSCFLSYNTLINCIADDHLKDFIANLNVLASMKKLAGSIRELVLEVDQDNLGDAPADFPHPRVTRDSKKNGSMHVTWLSEAEHLEWKNLHDTINDTLVVLKERLKTTEENLN